MRFIYSTLLLVTISAGTSLIANATSPEKCECKKVVVPAKCLECPYVIPKETENAQMGFLYIDYLFWKAQNNDWNWANTGHTGPIQFEDLIGLRGRPNWGSGCRFQVGFSKIFDWTISTIFTHYKKSTKERNVPGAISRFYPSQYHVGTSSKSNIHYNVADLEFAGSSYLNKTTLFKPIIGVRGAWLVDSYHHRIDTLTRGTGTVHSPLVPVTIYDSIPIHFWGFGPRLGSTITYKVGDTGLNFYGTLTGSLLCGKLKDGHRIKRIVYDTIGTFTSIYDFKDHFRDLKATIQLIIGGEYRYFFACHNKDLFVRLSWEGNYWIDQGNYSREFEILTQRSLFLHGINLGMGFDY